MNPKPLHAAMAKERAPEYHLIRPEIDHLQQSSYFEPEHRALPANPGPVQQPIDLRLLSKTILGVLLLVLTALSRTGLQLRQSKS